MIQSTHGNPCWYELMTPDLDGAQRFYSGLLGWSVVGAGMPDFDYRLADMGGTMVAGLMGMMDPGIPPHWLSYVAVDSADATVAQTKSLGGQVFKAPADIPGTGRFAVLGDPQGAPFGILQPLPMPNGQAGAFDPRKPGHANWVELRTSDTAAAMAFYGALFGWTDSRQMDMGPMGLYHMIAHNGTDIGGCFRPGGDTRPHWLPYFGVPSATAAVAAIGKTGARVLSGPDEVPGPMYTVQAIDPQGVPFALVGGK